jgi:hypothetical protein
VEPGFEPPFRFPVACGVEWVGPLNSVAWRTDDPEAAAGRLPVAWKEAIEDGMLTAEIRLRTDPARLSVTVGGRTVEYLPGSGPMPACR